MTRSPLAGGRPWRVLGALALVFALAHLPFLATSLEDIDSVNFALGIRDFDVATHRPHPPGYPVYIFLGKITTAIAGFVMNAPQSAIEARALSVLSLLAGLAAIFALYMVFGSLRPGAEAAAAPVTPGEARSPVDLVAFSATAVTVSCPLFWYLAVLGALPTPRQSLSLGDAIFLNNRGIVVPGPVFDTGAGYVLASLIVAIVATVVLAIASRRRRETTGKPIALSGKRT